MIWFVLRRLEYGYGRMGGGGCLGGLTHFRLVSSHIFTSLVRFYPNPMQILWSFIFSSCKIQLSFPLSLTYFFDILKIEILYNTFNRNTKRNERQIDFSDSSSNQVVNDWFFLVSSSSTEFDEVFLQFLFVELSWIEMKIILLLVILCLFKI